VDLLSDGSVDEVWEYTYDGEGFVTRLVSDWGFVQVFGYDHDHFVVHETQGMNSDDDSLGEWFYMRDADGRVLLREGSWANASSSTGTERVMDTNTYDDRGRPLTSVRLFETDGVATTRTEQYQYTGDDLVPSTGRLTDPEGNSVLRYTKSADELLIHLDIDDGEDGDVDRTIDWTLDSERRTLTRIFGENGVPIVREAWTYNSFGFVGSYEWSDSDESTPPDIDKLYAFSAEGMLTQYLCTSPNGDYFDAALTETYKSTCAPGSARIQPPRRGRDERPVRWMTSGMEISRGANEAQLSEPWAAANKLVASPAH
jgi:hypothetical protein